MTIPTVEIDHVLGGIVAHVNRLILATAEPDSRGVWTLSLRRGGSSYLYPDKATAIAALKTITSPLPPTVPDICTDATCCLACEHSGDDHDVGECWAAGDVVPGEQQCPCDWYHPALASHRHLVPEDVTA